MTESTVSEVVERLEGLRLFLNGEGWLCGCRFGQLRPDSEAIYWWRKHLSIMEEAATLLSTIKATGGGPSREEVARAIGSFPTHDEDRGPDNETLIDWLPITLGETMPGETFLYKLADAVLSLFSSEGKEDQDYRPELPCADAQERSPQGWRPIEDAQRGGTPILAGSVNHNTIEVVCWQDKADDVAEVAEDGWVNTGPCKDRFYANPRWFTHWMPLPEAPSPMAARDIGARAPQGADDASGNTPKPVSQPDHAPGEDEERCIACDVAFKGGDEYLPDESGGFIHFACCGPEREGFVNLDTGEPIGPDEPIPTPLIWADDPQPQTEGGAA